MYYVYLLKSEGHDFVYTGSTPDLERRLLERNTERVKFTKFYAPLKLIYYEAYVNEQAALNRENKLKHHGSAIGHLKKRLKNSLN